MQKLVTLGAELGRKKIGFYFHFYIIFWIVLNFPSMNMHVSYNKANQACWGLWEGVVCQEAWVLCTGVWCKNKAKHQTERMSYNCSQNKTVCEVPSLCVPVTGIMESAVSWHIQRQSQAPVVFGGFGGSVLRPGNRVNIQLYFLDNLPISLAVRTPFSMPLADTS